jgi:DNA-binding transcriptional MerR regulator
MRISELARRTGISVHTLRYYEGLGLLKAGRSASGYRDFSEGAVREVTFIVMGRDSGFSLKEIGEYLPAYRAGSLSVDTLIEAFAERLADVDAQIARLQVAARHADRSHCLVPPARAGQPFEGNLDDPTDRTPHPDQPDPPRTSPRRARGHGRALRETAKASSRISARARSPPPGNRSSRDAPHRPFRSGCTSARRTATAGASCTAG